MSVDQNIIRAVYKNYKRQADDMTELRFMILKEFVNRDDDRWSGEDVHFIWSLFDFDYPKEKE